MRKKSPLKVALLAGALLLANRGWAQQDSFAYRASLDTIKRAGWYEISLTPEIVAKCKENLADIRIADPHGQFIPYVLQSTPPFWDLRSSADYFIDFPILLSPKGVDPFRNVVVRNTSSRPVNSLLLSIRNTSVQRLFTLSGSDDREHWYIIKEHVAFGPGTTDSATSYSQRVDLPPSNYTYFKISQEGKGLPLMLFQVGTNTSHVMDVVGAGFKTPDPAISRKDSGDHSYITLSYKEPYIVDELTLTISSPALYKRSAKIYDKDHALYGVHVMIDPATQVYTLPPFKTREIMIDIDNGDNPPLVIDKILSTQSSRHLLSYLQPGQGYQLLVGNDKAAAPNYDLQSFADTISRTPAYILPGKLTAAGRPSPSPAKESFRDYKGIYLWTAIIVVLLLLIWLCLNMLKSVQRRQ